jgi:CHAT domain-containing protein
MDSLYSRLLAGAPVADALRQAQLSLLKRAPYSDPRFWAAFSLTGDPQARWHSAQPSHPR